MAKVITMWSGSTFPAHYTLCDGTNGTPDLRDRFVMGASPEKPLGDRGGSNNKTITQHGHEIPDHTHTFTPANGRTNSTSAGAGKHDTTSTRVGVLTAAHTHSVPTVESSEMKGTTAVQSSPVTTVDNRPLFYAMAYAKADHSGFPVGSICMWDSAIESIPQGWAVCDGSAPGRPDLTGRFIAGAGLAFERGQKGGVDKTPAYTHKHTYAHTHSASVSTANSTLTNPQMNGVTTGTASAATHGHSISGTVSTVTVESDEATIEAMDNLPLYHALIFIVREA